LLWHPDAPALPATNHLYTLDIDLSGPIVEKNLAVVVISMALVQTFGINATKRWGTLRGSCGENSIPNFGGSFAVDAKRADFELTLPNPVHQFNAGDGN
jgi:hypothetical protein